MRHLTALVAAAGLMAVFGYGATLRDVPFAPAPGEHVARAGDEVPHLPSSVHISDAAGDASVYALIDRLRPIANRIVLDGRGADWAGIPAFADASGDAGGDPSRDIVETAIAARDNDLLVRIATLGAPSRDDHAFWFDVDVWGAQPTDLQFGLSTGQRHTVWTYTPQGFAGSSSPVTGIHVRVEDVVEISVPYAVIERLARGTADGNTGIARSRPWIRVTPFTWDAATQAFVDYGAAAASFRLKPTPYPLDPPLPDDTTGPHPIELPVNDKWYVGQGAFGPWTHNSWSYDLYIVDASHQPARVRESRRNEDYYSWGRPVLAPTAARVYRTHDGSSDGTPPSRGGSSGEANHVYLELGGGLALGLVHFQQGTIRVGVAASVQGGSVLGMVGNSGASAWPHLHLDMWQLEQRRVVVPLALANVRVSLNSRLDDPWSRDLRAWEPRDGFFVERLAAF
ncbi:MAG: peptidoglycan DD-metalloendopeptidase family protein [Gemmatimonadetes bacterium]|nr:peptidoglycan DD-metalloendopeptidase family protein [Gemmatimonadota bacterium]